MQEWVTDIRDQCLGAKVPFFFKQWGGVQKKRAGRTLEGRTWDEMPANMDLVKRKFLNTKGTKDTKFKKRRRICEWMHCFDYNNGVLE